MRIHHLKLENWKNFRSVDLPLQRRVFIVGPNAAGKSNLLDALRFLRDIATPEGGFQRAIKSRGGVSQVRCLHARTQPNVAIEVHLDIDSTTWLYRLEFAQNNQRQAIIKREYVEREGVPILSRPDEADKDDTSRLTQTHLEQVIANKEFRRIADFLAQVRYLHVIPQLIRETDRVNTRTQDPYGSDFLEQMAQTQKKTLNSRLKKINDALKVAVPQLKELRLERDERGVPHLKGMYEHWRPDAGWQSEEQFSDGTLRLLGLLWAFLDGDAPLLLEEPELSLHKAVVQHIPAMMNRVARKTARQIILSTHSADLLMDPGISAQEVVILQPERNGTEASLASSDIQIRLLLEAGEPVAEAVLPRTAPLNAAQLSLFGND